MHGGSPSENDGAPGPLDSEARGPASPAWGGVQQQGGQYMYCTEIIIILIIHTIPCTQIQKCTIRELTIPIQKTTWPKYIK